MLFLYTSFKDTIFMNYMNMVKRKFLFFSFFFFSLLFSSFAQDYRITAELDSTNILIGDHIHVDVTVRFPKGEQVIIPPFTQNTIGSDVVEWITTSAMDTVENTDHILLNQQITITSFEEGNHSFPSLPLFGKDSQIVARSDPKFFIVNTVSVDTTASVKDIKLPERVPVTFREIVPYILLTFLTAAIITGIILIIMAYRKKKKKRQTTVPKVRIKPDVAAIEALDNLARRKLWQEGKIKLYYSELTEIIRIYIEGRYAVSAMEMPSSDILTELSEKEIAEDAYGKLRQILLNGDLVKFAKWDPNPEDHIRCLSDAREFIIATAEKPVAGPSNEEQKKDE